MAQRRHPLLGLVEGEDILEDIPEPTPVPKPVPGRQPTPGSAVGMVWDDEKGCPVPPPPDPPPVDLAQLAEEQDPGIRTLMRKVAEAALRRLVRKLDS